MAVFLTASFRSSSVHELFPPDYFPVDHGLEGLSAATHFALMRTLLAHVIGAGGGVGIATVDALCERGISELVISETNEDRAKCVEPLLAQFWPNVIGSKIDPPGSNLDERDDTW